MKLLLHSPVVKAELNDHYKEAFSRAIELYVVSAYLTAWDSSLKLNRACRGFKVIVGKDFGITRKEACRELMKWLPAGKKHQFSVADKLDGFHPKAVFWKESGGECFAIIGSSNLTNAAFETNYEANVFGKIAADQFATARTWVQKIESFSVPMTERWLSKYTEAPRGSSRGKKTSRSRDLPGTEVVQLTLPEPDGMAAQIAKRRKQIEIFETRRNALLRLFRRCANGQITPMDFYLQLPACWSNEIGNRLQGRGWEILGKNSEFNELSVSFLAIFGAKAEERDDVVVREIDRLSECTPPVPTRRAFLSEMLCLFFPDAYPVLNNPVWKYMRAIDYHAPRGASEGVKYIYLARMLRYSLLQNPKHPAKDLAELDTVIWLEYGKD